ncbi:DNA/RNA helicase domain-containing protein [Plantactinospora sp. GCM10030261]|uniref:DUF2075 domain-containing protein n=1 Tax=Plantactinospora sp. GCM10030261 TaxID=3273420 RepID=UPI003613F38D
MIYTPEQSERFAAYLDGRFLPASGRPAADRLLRSEVRASEHLLRYAAEELGNRRHFVLLDQQRTALGLVMRGVRWARRGRRKRVVIVSGGPGTGKSAIALSLLAKLAGQDVTIAHATGSRAFTSTLRRYARRDPRDPRQRTNPLFNYFRDFANDPPDSIDVLICDEAHRIRTRSDRGGVFGKIPQVDELINVAKVAVFLLDGHQALRSNEVGTVEAIHDAALRHGCEPELITLGGQFRCGGSPLFEWWVDRLLEVGPDGPVRWDGDDTFQLRVADSPEEMERFLAQRRSLGESARITAGFCWDWTRQTKNGRLVDDVRIGDWSKPWNAYATHPPRGIPSSAYWATDPGGFGQVGCAYTAQGFEYDWAGVIFGQDLVLRGGRLATYPEASRDLDITGGPGKPRPANPHRLIRNAYKVLLTRGLRGCLIYSVDPETQEFLKGLVSVAGDRERPGPAGAHQLGKQTGAERGL